MKIPKGLQQSTPWLFATISLPCQATNTGIGQCIGDIYNWSIAIVGIAAFIQVVRAGIEYFTAAGNASDAKDAKSKISDAILGIILLFSSYVILRTINPDLVGGGPGTAIFNPGGSNTIQLFLASASPTRAPVGGLITLSGTGFTNASKVLIDGSPFDSSQFMINGSTEIIVELKDAGSISFTPGETIEISVKDGTKETTAKTIVITGDKDITITSLSSSQGNPGDKIKLTGTNLSNKLELSWDDTTIDYTFINSTQIEFTVPSDTKLASPGVHKITASLNDIKVGPLSFVMTREDSSGSTGDFPDISSVDLPREITFGEDQMIRIVGDGFKTGVRYQLVMGDYGTYEVASVNPSQITFQVGGDDNNWEINGGALPTSPTPISVYFYQDGKLVQALGDVTVNFPTE